MKNIYVDIDNTICKTSGSGYENSTPYPERITFINKLFDKGYQITYWTARGTVTGIDYYMLTKDQLETWGAKYHNLILGKPAYDILIDDKAINNIKIIWIAKEVYHHYHLGFAGNCGG